jgi:hypothetical protein
VETEGLMTAVERAGVPQEQFCEGVCDKFDFAVGVDGTEGGGVRVAFDGANDALDCSSPAEDGAEDSVARPSLGSGIHFSPVLLVSEDNGYEFGF